MFVITPHINAVNVGRYKNAHQGFITKHVGNALIWINANVKSGRNLYIQSVIHVFQILNVELITFHTSRIFYRIG